MCYIDANDFPSLPPSLSSPSVYYCLLSSSRPSLPLLPPDHRLFLFVPSSPSPSWLIPSSSSVYLLSLLSFPFLHRLFRPRSPFVSYFFLSSLRSLLFVAYFLFSCLPFLIPSFSSFISIVYSLLFSLPFLSLLPSPSLHTSSFRRASERGTEAAPCLVKPGQISRHKATPHLHFRAPTSPSTPAACWRGPRLIAPNYCCAGPLRA